MNNELKSMMASTVEMAAEMDTIELCLVLGSIVSVLSMRMGREKVIEMLRMGGEAIPKTVPKTVTQ